MPPCQHFAEAQTQTQTQAQTQAQTVPSRSASHAKGCEDCVKLGDTWVHLRECLLCGHVGCCDSSKNTHATRHFHASRHPVMRSVEPGETWGWCYVDELMAQVS